MLTGIQETAKRQSLLEKPLEKLDENTAATKIQVTHESKNVET